MKTKIVPGMTFGRLTVKSLSHQDSRWRRHWFCRCVCGATKTVQASLLASGNTKSCGCLGKETARFRALPHGEASINQVLAGYKHKAKKSGLEFSLTRPQFVSLIRGRCFYCGILGTNTHISQHGTGDLAYNGLDRIHSERGYTISNTVPACKRCNFAKSNRSQGEFIEWIRRVFRHLEKTAMADQWGSLQPTRSHQ
jgi:hypothetical protein